MKENVIKKINNIGKISNIVVWIIGIILTIGMIISLIAAVICFRLPEDTFTIDLDGKMDFTVNYEKLGLSDAVFSGIESEDWVDEEKNRKAGDFSIVFVDQEYKLKEIEYGDGKILMQTKVDSMGLNIRHIAILCLGAFLEMGITIVALYFVGAVCKEIRKCNSPFEENVVKKIRNLAIALLPWSILSSSLTSSMEKWTQGIAHIGISVDLGIILIVVGLVYIFKYGAVLQQESDETL